TYPSTFRSEIRLCRHDFLLFHARSGKCRLRFLLVVGHACDQAFDKCAIELDLINYPNFLVTQRAQGLCCGSAVTFGQCVEKPIMSDSRCSSGGICRPNGIDCLMQWARISVEFQFP